MHVARREKDADLTRLSPSNRPFSSHSAAVPADDLRRVIAGRGPHCQLRFNAHPHGEPREECHALARGVETGDGLTAGLVERVARAEDRLFPGSHLEDNRPDLDDSEHGAVERLRDGRGDMVMQREAMLASMTA